MLEVGGQRLELDFPGYIRTHPAADKWDLHNEYEKVLAQTCYSRLIDRWRSRLQDSETYLRDNWWAMMETLTVQMPEQRH